MSPPPEPVLAVVVVSYNAREDLLRCLGALEREVAAAREVVVVDNASRDGSVEAVRAAFPSVRVIANRENLGFSRANNQGLQASQAPFVLVLNPDCEVRKGAVEHLLERLRDDPGLAVAGPRTLGSDGRVQVSTGPLLTPWAERSQRQLVHGVKRGDPAAIAQADAVHAREHEPVWVSGACMLIRRSALLAAGGFDEGFFLYEEDVDLCVRLRQAGYRVLFAPKAEVVHHLGRSMAKEPLLAPLEYHRSHLRFYRKHVGAWAWAGLRLKLLAQGLAGSFGPRRVLSRALLRLALRGH